MENFIEMIVGGFKKFGSEIVFFILITLLFWLFPGLKRRYDKYKGRDQGGTETEIKKQLKLLKEEEQQLEKMKEVLRSRDEALKLTEYQTAEEARHKAEIQKKLDEHRKEEKRVKAEIRHKQEALRQEEARKAEETRKKAEIERQREEQRSEKERIRAEIKQKKKALKQAELRKAEETRLKAEAQKQLEAQRQNSQTKQEKQQYTPTLSWSLRVRYALGGFLYLVGHAVRIMWTTPFLLLLGGFFISKKIPDKHNSGFLMHFAVSVAAAATVSAIIGFIAHAFYPDREGEFKMFFRGSLVFFCFIYGLAYFMGW